MWISKKSVEDPVGFLLNTIHLRPTSSLLRELGFCLAVVPVCSVGSFSSAQVGLSRPL